MNNLLSYDNEIAPYKDDPKSFRRKLDNQLAPHLDTWKLLDQLLKKRPKGVYHWLQKVYEREERLSPMTEQQATDLLSELWQYFERHYQARPETLRSNQRTVYLNLRKRQSHRGRVQGRLDRSQK